MLETKIINPHEALDFLKKQRREDSLEGILPYLSATIGIKKIKPEYDFRKNPSEPQAYIIYEKVPLAVGVSRIYTIEGNEMFTEHRRVAEMIAIYVVPAARKRKLGYAITRETIMKTLERTEEDPWVYIKANGRGMQKIIRSIIKKAKLPSEKYKGMFGGMDFFIDTSLPANKHHLMSAL